MSMRKDVLLGHLKNGPLIQALKQKAEIDGVRKRLANALGVMREANVAQAAIEETEGMFKEYQNISKGYGILLEDVWGINWQQEGLILTYIDYSDIQLANLPEQIKYL